MKYNAKSILSVFTQNYFLSLFISIVIFTVLVGAVKLFYLKSDFIYVKVKAGPGYWWAAGSLPQYWFVKAVHKGEKEKGLFGRTDSEIVGYRYYPVSQSFNMFLQVKIRANYSKSTGEYSFKRSPVSVGSPIEFEFPSSYITGTIIDISKKPIEDKLETHTLELIANTGYSEDLPFRYNSIKVGDSYFDGEGIVFKILDKQITPSKFLSSDLYGNVYEKINNISQHIIIKAMVKVKNIDGNLIYGEDQIILNGRYFNPSTSNFDFGGYAVGKID